MTISDKYELIEKRSVKDLTSVGYLLRHKRTGARLFVLENDDKNKVFYIGFRTPPSDSTGVPHIMEHSVLCGSERFPAKDPFVELAKGSLNTFLNAMTYPDKTVYPVASCNDKDFKNLMHVYMDAVFRPNIYSREQIFKQEGWHYETDGAEDEITINGVVYNEMKGAFSSPEDMLDRKIYEALYPDTAYALESGGDPDCIPELTYEAFLDFHRKYYHPSNCYIYLYGDCDMAERLEWLDEAYLSGYEQLEVDSALTLQKGFDEMVEKNISYGITEEEETEDNTYMAYSCVIESVLDRELYLAFQILDYVLLSAPGAPLKEKLLKSGICRDVMSTYENGILQPYFSVMIKNSNAKDKDRFLSIIRESLSELSDGGIDRKALEAGLNYFEFKYREADFGVYPKGLMYGLQCLDSWLYDDRDPFMHISATETIEYLKGKIGSGYFEGLIKKYLIDNPHCALVISEPIKGLVAKNEEKLAIRLKAMADGMSREERQALADDTIALKRYQEEPSTYEELLSIPLLDISDIEKKAPQVDNEELTHEGVKYLYHDVPSNGIGYLTLAFDMGHLPHELVPYASVLKTLLGVISTENYSYFELANEINRKSGGISAGISGYNREKGYKTGFEIDAKMLMDKTDFVFDMIEEILFSSKLDEYVRIRELLMMMKSRMQMSMLSAGHIAAALRARSYFSDMAYFEELTGGYEFYRFVDELEGAFDEKKEELTEKLKEVLELLLCRERLLVSFGGSREALSAVQDRMGSFVKRLSDEHYEDVDTAYDKHKRNEGFKSASQVQYAAMAGDFKKEGLKYNGGLRVLKTIMGYDYLWINVRVKGGAYGCMSRFARSGAVTLVSYRDPNLSETFEIYRQAEAYLKEFDAPERDMKKYIIGTMSEVDTPLTPKMRCDRGLALYLSGVTYEDIQRERDEILSMDNGAVRALAPYVGAAARQENICVIGGEARISKEEGLFLEVKNLF